MKFCGRSAALEKNEKVARQYRFGIRRQLTAELLDGSRNR